MRDIDQVRPALAVAILLLVLPTAASAGSPEKSGGEGIHFWNLALKWEYRIFFGNWSGYEPHNPPIIEDIDADGRVEIIVHGVTFGMGFIVLDGMTGKEKWRKELNGYGVTLANLDSDPQEELLVYDPMLYCIDGRTGDLQWTFAGKPTTLEPLLADLDGDGSREIVAMWEGGISILSPEGKLKGLVSFPSRIPRPFGFTSGDLDGDGADELLVSLGNEILVLKGEEVERTYRVTPGNRITSLSLIDLDGDGSREIVAISLPEPSIREEGSAVWVFDIGGSLAWRQNLGPGHISSPCFSDLDGDGNLEIIIGRASLDQLVVETGGTVALKAGGSVLWSSPSPTFEKPVCADIDGDGRPEVIGVGLGGSLVSLSGESGDLEWSLEQLLAMGTPSVGDVDGDGWPEIVVNSGQDEVNCLEGAEVKLHLSEEDGELLISWSFSKRPLTLYYPITVEVLRDGMVMERRTVTRPPVRLKLGGHAGRYIVRLLYGDQVMASGEIGASTGMGTDVGSFHLSLILALVIATALMILLVGRMRYRRGP